MFICICNAVTDRHIRELAAEGVHSLEELRRVSGCGDCCGRCADEAEAVLAGALSPVAVMPLVTAAQAA